MKDRYIKPQADIEQFKTVDVITTSDIRDDDNIVDGGKDWD